MRSQLLKVLQRAPAGLASSEAMQAMRASFASGEASTLLSNLRKEESGSAAPKGLGFQKMNLPFSLNAHMSTLASANQERQENIKLSAADVPKAPAALVALPPRRGMAGAAHASAKDVYMSHTANRHPFHVLPPSPWPLLGGFGSMMTCLGMIGWFHAIPTGTELMFAGLASTLWTAICWWRDVIIEGDMGMHSEIVKKNMISGMWIFIISEAMLFFGFLWACIDHGLSPSVAVQMQWPPVGVEPIAWDKRALVMSAVLAASYYSANVAMVAKDPKTVMGALATTIGLGAMFLVDQYIEYNETPFTITDSAYGTTFYITTGFHGMHVLFGSIYLACALGMYARTHKAGVALQASVLYWHFVDIVWIAVYGIIYLGQF